MVKHNGKIKMFQTTKFSTKFSTNPPAQLGERGEALGVKLSHHSHRHGRVTAG